MEQSSSFFNSLWQGIQGAKIRDIIRFAFISSVLIFLLIHMYGLTNQLVNHDYALISNGIGGMGNIGELYNESGGISSGRFLLSAANYPSSLYTLPWFTGLLCALYFAVSVCIVVSLFQIRSKLSVVLISAVMAAFPTAASTLSFMYTADAYFMALMLSCLGAFLAHRYKWGWPVAALIFAASLGIYQSYFCFGAALLVFSLIVTNFRESLSAKDTVLLCARDFLALVLGLALYKIALDIILSVTGTELSTYMGIDHMWYLPVWELGTRLKDAFRYTLMFYGIFSFYSDLIHFSYLFMLLVMAAASVYIIIKKEIFKSPVKLVVTVLLIIISPLSCSLIWVMSGSVHLLMVYPVVLMTVAAIALLDSIRLSPSRSFGNFIRSALGTVLLLAVLIQCSANTVAANKAYLKLDNVFKNAYAFCLKLSVRIESTDGYYQGIPIMLIGEVSESNRPVQSPIMHKEFEAFSGISTEHSLIARKCIPAFFSFFLGEEVNSATPEQTALVYSNPVTDSMEVYPNPGSVQVIDDVMVIKLGEPQNETVDMDAES